MYYNLADLIKKIETLLINNDSKILLEEERLSKINLDSIKDPILKNNIKIIKSKFDELSKYRTLFDSKLDNIINSSKNKIDKLLNFKELFNEELSKEEQQVLLVEKINEISNAIQSIEQKIKDFFHNSELKNNISGTKLIKMFLFEIKQENKIQNLYEYLDFNKHILEEYKSNQNYILKLSETYIENFDFFKDNNNHNLNTKLNKILKLDELLLRKNINIEFSNDLISKIDMIILSYLDELKKKFEEQNTILNDFISEISNIYNLNGGLSETDLNVLNLYINDFNNLKNNEFNNFKKIEFFTHNNFDFSDINHTIDNIDSFIELILEEIEKRDNEKQLNSIIHNTNQLEDLNIIEKRYTIIEKNKELFLQLFKIINNNRIYTSNEFNDVFENNKNNTHIMKYNTLPNEEQEDLKLIMLYMMNCEEPFIINEEDLKYIEKHKEKENISTLLFDDLSGKMFYLQFENYLNISLSPKLQTNIKDILIELKDETDTPKIFLKIHREVNGKLEEFELEVDKGFNFLDTEQLKKLFIDIDKEKNHTEKLLNDEQIDYISNKLKSIVNYSLSNILNKKEEDNLKDYTEDTSTEDTDLNTSEQKTNKRKMPISKLSKVRSHKRKFKSGKTTSIKQHYRNLDKIIIDNNFNSIVSNILKLQINFNKQVEDIIDNDTNLSSVEKKKIKRNNEDTKDIIKNNISNEEQEALQEQILKEKHSLAEATVLSVVQYCQKKKLDINSLSSYFNKDTFDIFLNEELKLYSSKVLSTKELDLLFEDSKTLFTYIKEKGYKKFKISNLNDKKNNFKGYDFLVTDLDNKLEDTYISYKFKEGRSFNNMDSSLITHSHDIKKLKEELQPTTIEIDKYIKENTNLVDLLKELSLDIIPPKEGKNDKKIKETIKMIKKKKININLLFKKNNIDYETIDLEKGQPQTRYFAKLPDIIDKIIISAAHMIVNCDKKKEDINKYIEQKLFLNQSYLSSSYPEETEYLVRYIYRNTQIQQKLFQNDLIEKRQIGESMLIEQEKFFLESLRNYYKEGETNKELKKEQLIKLLHLENQGNLIMLGEGKIIEYPRKEYILSNIDNISINIGKKVSITNSEINFNLEIKDGNTNILSLNSNKIKYKKGLLVGSPSVELASTSDKNLIFNQEHIIKENIKHLNNNKLTNKPIIN